MDKFIKLYVTQTDETGGYRLVSCNDILQIQQASTTTVTITYRNAVAAADVLTITHSTLAANSYAMRDFVADQIETALSTSWQSPAYTVDQVFPDNAAGTAPITIADISIA